MINHDVALEHDAHRILKKAMLPWFRYAHENEIARRNEEMSRENKIAFDRMMEQAEASAQVRYAC